MKTKKGHRGLFLSLLFIFFAFGRAFRIDRGSVGKVLRNQFQMGRNQGVTQLNAEKVRFKNFEQVLDAFHEEPVVIYFSTPKCGPCKLMKKELKEVNTKIGNEFKMFNIDTEKWPKIASRLDVATLPCLVLFREGEVKLRLEGVVPAESIIKQIKYVIEKDKR